MLRGQVRISQGHFQVGMPHQFPDGIQILPGHNQFACKIVPHVMPAEITHFRRFKKVAPSVLNIVSDLSFRASEYQPGRFVRLFFPSSQNSQGDGVQWNMSRLAGLGRPSQHRHDGIVNIYILPRQLYQFSPSDSRMQ